MKKKIGTRILSIILTVLTVVSILPMSAIPASAATTFTPRLTAPAKSGWYASYTRNNCTKYANCRINEIVGWEMFPNNYTLGISKIVQKLVSHGYASGNVPKVGAVAVQNGNGHVAVVEKIENGCVYMSEGHYATPYGEDMNKNIGASYLNTVRIGPGNTPIYDRVSEKRPKYGYGTWFTLHKEANYYNYTYYYLINDGGSSSVPTPPKNNGNNYVDNNANYTSGTYECFERQGVNMRSGAGTNYSKLGLLVPNGARIQVVETYKNWGKTTYNGKTGWVCLNYFNKVSVPVPATPTISSISSENVAKGKSVTISWNPVSGAENYTVAIRSKSVYKDINVGNTTQYSYVLSNAEQYYFYVCASNVSGASNWSSPRGSKAHNAVTVSFVDWDNTPLGTQTVAYGQSATPPSAPQRKGYSFQGWSDSFYNLTSDKTIKATYKINTYTVNFFDRDGTLIDSQKVNYGGSATPPTDKHETAKYKFVGWSDDSYLDVYTDSADKAINIYGIYSWYNYDLPASSTIKSAMRQYDGYYVTFDIENGTTNSVTGRAVVALKTAEGKLVDMTESTAFSIPAGKTKNDVEVFIPCTKVASSIEVFMVADYASGVPISPSATTSITEGLLYTESEIKPDNSDGTLDIQTITQYSYRDKEFSTGNTKTKDGWTYTGNRTEKAGSWSSWSWNSISTFDNETSRREVQTQKAVKSYNTKTVYNYWRYAAAYSGGRSSITQSSTFPNIYAYSFDEQLQQYGITSQGVMGYKWWYTNGSYVILYKNSPETSIVNTSANYATQYRYRDVAYTYSFYRWNAWSDFSETAVSATDNREVKTRTIYRYKSNNVQPEDTTGNFRTTSGKLDASFAGKQITLYVYGYTGASDYTNQYIGQSVVAADGSYSFTYKLREEPTIQSGDYTIAIGVEGTTDRTVIGTIEAPVPTYEVKFYDWDGSVISTQTVKEGDDAVLPENPTREGYNFVGWDKSVANIREDMEFYADFEQKEYTVIFVNWENQQIEVKKFKYGDVLVPPEAEQIDGHTFSGWDCGDISVTQDMVVSAQYEANEYTVKFYDWNNNVIDTQKVKYGETAVTPDEPTESGVNFASWFNPEDYQYVEHDAAIYPSYYFDETTDVPTANYQTGEYDSNISLELTSSDSNAVIYYYINDDETAEQIYTKPITVDKTCSVTYYATSFGKNDSEKATGYYCINTGDKPSEWMLYSELPNTVKENLSDYKLESGTGYKYKDIQKVSDLTEIENLKNTGWTLGNTSYAAYSDWQDEEITAESNLLGFEIDTRLTDDTSVVWYQYSHYKYTDDNGTVAYSPTEVAGKTCTLETVTVESRLSIAGFTDDNVSYYNYDSQQWFNQKKVNGQKTQYRSRYKVAEYYKWTAWDVATPASGDTREKQTDTVYRYSNKNYHIVWLDIYGSVLMVEDGKTIPTDKLDSIEGYNFVGLYSDEDLTTSFALSTPITESITVFTKYTPKQYTVVFQMQDGTEIDTQTVNYLEAAVSPDTDVVPGYVFGGWDKSFDCITEDTVITGKYFKEAEYARVSLNKTSSSMFQGSTISLTATITPSNLTDEIIEWSSSDPNVASVDDTGKITAISAGVTTITAKVVKTNETDTCKITVENDKDNYIVLKTDSSLKYDSLGYLRGVELKTTVSDISKEFANDELKFYNINGKELTSTDYIGTGTQIKLINGGSVVDSKTVVVTGDMTGDGIINNRDVAMMNKMLVGRYTATECQILAIDVNGDGYTNNRDAAMVARYLVGKENF